MSTSISETFLTVPGFCGKCGSILPLLQDKGGVKCYTCKEYHGPEAFGDMKIEYTIHFNTSDKNEVKRRIIKQEEPEGPVVERLCPKCNNNKMSYATLQLRSADEGQTVFYTCTKCKYKETENS